LNAETHISWCEEHRVLYESFELLSRGNARSACCLLEKHLERGGLYTESIVINLLGAYLGALHAPMVQEAFVDDVLMELMEGNTENPAIASNLALLLMKMERFSDAVSVYDLMAMSGFNLQVEDLGDYALATLHVGEPTLCQRVADFIEFEVFQQDVELEHVPELLDRLIDLRIAGVC
jgi:hypothetical protein